MCAGRARPHLTSEGTAPATVAQQLRIHGCSEAPPAWRLPTRPLPGLPARAAWAAAQAASHRPQRGQHPYFAPHTRASLYHPGSYARLARAPRMRLSFCAHAAALCRDPRACPPAMPAAAHRAATSAQPALGHPAGLTRKECLPALTRIKRARVHVNAYPCRWPSTRARARHEVHVQAAPGRSPILP
jgi:hypothetical protein